MISARLIAGKSGQELRSNSAVEEIVVALIIVISIPSIWVMALFPGLSYTEGIGWEFFIGAIITYFLVGAIIGWIYEKIRSKK